MRLEEEGSLLLVTLLLLGLRQQRLHLLEPSKMGTYVTYPYLEQLHGYRALDT